MRFTVDQQILQNVLNFLAEQPYKTTVQLINSLQADVKPTTDETTTSDVATVTPISDASQTAQA